MAAWVKWERVPAEADQAVAAQEAAALATGRLSLAREGVAVVEEAVAMGMALAAAVTAWWKAAVWVRPAVERT